MASRRKIGSVLAMPAEVSRNRPRLLSAFAAISFGMAATGLLPVQATAATCDARAAASPSPNCKAVPGRSDITIKRDEYGVPHIYASTTYALFYGYGYAIAQDRLFQLEMARRSTEGTVSEVLGEKFVDFDKSSAAIIGRIRSAVSLPRCRCMSAIFLKAMRPV